MRRSDETVERLGHVPRDDEGGHTVPAVRQRRVEAYLLSPSTACRKKNTQARYLVRPWLFRGKRGPARAKGGIICTFSWIGRNTYLCFCPTCVARGSSLTRLRSTTTHRQHGVRRDSQHDVDRSRGLLVGVLEGRAGALGGAVPKAVPRRHSNIVRHSRDKARYYLEEEREGGYGDREIPHSVHFNVLPNTPENVEPY